MCWPDYLNSLRFLTAVIKQDILNYEKTSVVLEHKECIREKRKMELKKQFVTTLYTVKVRFTELHTHVDDSSKKGSRVELGVTDVLKLDAFGYQELDPPYTSTRP